VLDLIALLHRWAESGWSHLAAGTWALLNSSVVPGPSEALLIPLGLADPRRAFTLAAWTIAGAILGGFVAYGLGAFAYDSVGEPLLTWMGMSAARQARVHALFEARGGVMVVATSLPVLGSAKMASIAAGAFGVPVPQFVLALLATRVLRFLGVAAAMRFAGHHVEAWVQRRTGRSVARLGRR
jgi:membrane protein YqaA with SNARE-associated domain